MGMTLAQAGVQQPTSLGPGSVLGDYTLLNELGRGGYGVVWEATDNRDGARVAVKTLLADLSDAAGQRAYARFKVEIEAVGRIRHPNVVTMREAGQVRQPGGRILSFYAMELISGRTLDKVVVEHGPLQPLMAAQIMQQAATGLHTAHAHGIIHRDIKPENIMLASDARVVVMDFGVCKIQDVGNITAADTVVGTARYLSPEQFLGEEVKEPADIFALGAVLYFLLAGDHLRVQKDVSALFRGIVNKEDLKSVEECARIPPVLKQLLRKALATEPGKRFPSAAALAEGLENACLELQGLGPRAVEPSPEPSRPVMDPVGSGLSSVSTSDGVFRSTKPPYQVAEAEIPALQAVWDLPPAAPPAAPLPVDWGAAPGAILLPPAEQERVCEDCNQQFAGPEELRQHREVCQLRQWGARVFVQPPRTPYPPPQVQPGAPDPNAGPWGAEYHAAPVPDPVDTTPTPCPYCGNFFAGQEACHLHSLQCPVRAWHERNFSGARKPIQGSGSASRSPSAAPGSDRKGPESHGSTRDELEELAAQARALGKGEVATLAHTGLDAVVRMCTVLQQRLGTDPLLGKMRTRLVHAGRKMLRLANTLTTQQVFLERSNPAELEKQIRQLLEHHQAPNVDLIRRKDTQWREAVRVDQGMRRNREVLTRLVEVMCKTRGYLDVAVAVPDHASARPLSMVIKELVGDVEAAAAKSEEPPGK